MLDLQCSDNAYIFFGDRSQVNPWLHVRASNANFCVFRAVPGAPDDRERLLHPVAHLGLGPAGAPAHVIGPGHALGVAGPAEGLGGEKGVDRKSEATFI